MSREQGKAPPHRPREQWGSRWGFILAAIGSAIGLGNIWRFPAEAYRHGGGAFLVPYLLALITAGLPLLILTYTIGRRYASSPPGATRMLTRRAEAIGWWQVAICVVIAVYYAAVLAWALRYIFFSLNQAWEDHEGGSEGFFFEEFLDIAEQPGEISGFVPGVAWPLALIWVAVLVVLVAGVRRGIERANKIFIPLLVVIFAVLVVRSLTLDGAEAGLDAFFSPDWSALGEGSVWVAAYGQIFFSLSVGFGIMIAYASYLHRRADLSGSALTAGFANSSFEILAGIAVFSTLGFMATRADVAVSEVSSSGVGLAFVVFPQIISEMPLGTFFGVLFFSSLVIAGFTSLVSIVQVVVASVEDRTGLGRRTVVLSIGGAMALVSVLLFANDSGLYYLDVSDHFINHYGIVLAALALVIVVSWVSGKLPLLQREADTTSAFRLGWWWRICLSIITPVMLAWIMISSLVDEFETNYEGYETSFLITSGWAVAGGALVLGVVLSLVRWRRTPTAPRDEPTARASVRATIGPSGGDRPPRGPGGPGGPDGPGRDERSG